MDKFEKYLQDKLQNLSVEPSAELWERISHQITPWYKKITGKIAIFSTVGALIITTIFISSLHTKQNLALKQTTYQIVQPEFNKFIPRKQKIIDTSQKRKNYNNGIVVDRKINSKNNEFNFIKENKTTTESQAVTLSTQNNPKKDINNDTTNKIPFTTFYETNFDFKYYITPVKGCAPLTCTFYVKPQNKMNITWFIDKKVISSADSFQMTLDAGIHQVQLIIFDSIQTVVIKDTIEVLPKPKAQFNLTDCNAGDSVKIRNFSQNAKTYIWYFGDGDSIKCDTPEHIYRFPGTYRVTLIAKNDFCSDTASQLIFVDKQPQYIVFPNAFVPSINGPTGGYYNPNKPERSIFHPVVRKAVVKYHLVIYDRRGKVIFETNSINQGWDGYYKGKLVPIGVYIYVASGEFEDGQKFVKKGDITVIYKN